MEPTLVEGSTFGKENKGFTVTSVDRENGVYYAEWDGQFVKPLNGVVEVTTLWCPDVVIDIQRFEELNKQFIEEGVMAYLPIKLYEDYKKEVL